MIVGALVPARVVGGFLCCFLFARFVGFCFCWLLYVVRAFAYSYIYRGGAVRFFFAGLWLGPLFFVFFGWALPFW